MSSGSVSQTIFLLCWALILRISTSEEVCCCPSINLYLTCEEQDGTVKLMNNNYRCVAKKDADVKFMCQLEDADHPSVQSVVYKFYRAGALQTNTLSTDQSAAQVCSSTTDSSECTMPSVQWKKKTGSATTDKDMSGADNHFYQCLAAVTLVDGTTHTIVSRTLYLDVVFEPTAPTAPTSGESEIKNIGFPSISMACSLPVANPPTQPIWEYKDTVIDIPPSTRMDRLAVIKQADAADRGTFLVMNFTPAEDNGDYKCYAQYTDLFTGATTKDLVSWYTISDTGNDNNIDPAYEAISSVASPVLMRKDDPIYYTAYFKDASATVDGEPKAQMQYEWLYYNAAVTGKTTWEKLEASNQYTGDIFTNNAEISNGGRTLKLTNIYSIFSGENNKGALFKCTATRTGETGNPPQSSQFGNEDDDDRQLFLPEVFKIPVTSQTCVTKTENIQTIVNQEYMRVEPKEGVESKQLLIKNGFKFLYNDVPLTVLTNAPPPVAMIKDEGLTYPGTNFDAKFPSNQNDRCLYFQYLSSTSYKNKIGAAYHMLDTAKVDRSDSGCSDIVEATCSDATMECKDGTLSIALAQYTSAQCVAVELKNAGNVVSNRKYFPQVATSCSQRNMTLSFAASDLLTDGGMTSLSGDLEVSVVPAYGGKTGCSHNVKCGAASSFGIIGPFQCLCFIVWSALSSS